MRPAITLSERLMPCTREDFSNCQHQCCQVLRQKVFLVSLLSLCPFASVPSPLSSLCTVTQNLSVLFLYCLSISPHLVLHLSMHSCLHPSSLLAVFSSFCLSVCITVLFRQTLPRPNSYPQHSQPDIIQPAGRCMLSSYLPVATTLISTIAAIFVVIIRFRRMMENWMTGD